MTKRGHTPANEYSLESKLVHNMIELQKIHTNLAEKFDNLSGQISTLLKLFEMTAQGFASNPANQITQKDREFLDKIDKLLEQNKTIAKGLTLMEEKVRDKVVGSLSLPQYQRPMQMSMPQMQMNNEGMRREIKTDGIVGSKVEEFQPSMASQKTKTE